MKSILISIDAPDGASVKVEETAQEQKENIYKNQAESYAGKPAGRSRSGKSKVDIWLPLDVKDAVRKMAECNRVAMTQLCSDIVTNYIYSQTFKVSETVCQETVCLN